MPSSVSVDRARMRLGRHGATTLEFALVAAMTISLTLGAIETGRYLFTLESVRAATAEAARLVTLRGSANMMAGIAACSGLAGSIDGVVPLVPFLRRDLLTATMSACTTSSGVTTVTVTLSYPFDFVLPAFGGQRRVIVETAMALLH